MIVNYYPVSNRVEKFDYSKIKDCRCLNGMFSAKPTPSYCEWLVPEPQDIVTNLHSCLKTLVEGYDSWGWTATPWKLAKYLTRRSK